MRVKVYHLEKLGDEFKSLSYVNSYKIAIYIHRDVTKMEPEGEHLVITHKDGMDKYRRIDIEKLEIQ